MEPSRTSVAPNSLVRAADNALRVPDKSGEVVGRGYLGAVNSDGTTSGDRGRGEIENGEEESWKISGVS